MEGSILWIFRLVRQVDQRLGTWRRLALQVNHRGQVPTDDWGCHSVRVHAGHLPFTIRFWSMPVVQGFTATDQSGDSIEVDRSHQTAGQEPKPHLLKPPHLIDRHTRLWPLTDFLEGFRIRLAAVQDETFAASLAAR